MGVSSYKGRRGTVTVNTEDGFEIKAEFRYPKSREIRDADWDSDIDFLSLYITDGPFVDGEKIDLEDLAAPDCSELSLQFMDFIRPPGLENLES